ncbi:hypothetical protein SEA_GRETCHEN_44 [Microbacterium phage Gretchen]|uniref:Uncharacterized protein n=1 Tax=Microbacterium phage Percival TaxID=2201439 RepID=A0A2Z4Q6N2_9CAUD|nr:hypothetical protein PBI_PERCIVAL_45 [Microbacterium phage Percival]UDL14818.1 hypothetical protein SEA_GRETCHEN_44 [Microbacterium phage Gretchen]
MTDDRCPSRYTYGPGPDEVLQCNGTGQHPGIRHYARRFNIGWLWTTDEQDEVSADG